MKNDNAPSVANAHEKGQMQGVAAVAAGSALSAYERDILRTAKENHIWLNAFACVRPTDAFKMQLADQILAMLNDKSALIHDHQDSSDENWRALGKLTPELIVRINKS